LFGIQKYVSFSVFDMVGIKKLLIVILVPALAILTAIPCVSAKYVVPAYAEYGIWVDCGPTQQSDLAISISTRGFSPNTFLHYKFIRPDNSVTYGGVSAGTFGENTVAINVGSNGGAYRIYVYNDINNSYNTALPIYSSTIMLPCKTNHFTTEYYKMHPQVFQYLLGIKPIYNEIKIGDYLVASPKNALNIINLSHSNKPIDQLAAQLLGAELNSASGGTESCIDRAIYSANTLLKDKNYSGPTNSPRTTSGENLEMLSLKNKIESYNRIGCA
jgi:hypothetical protein